MGFLDAILKALFGGGRKLPPGPSHNQVPPSQRPPAPRPAPPPAPPPPISSTPPIDVPPPAPVPPPPAAPLPPPPVTDGAAGFIASLRAADSGPLKREDYIGAARRLGCEPEAVMAVVAVESGKSGFENGRPLILFEPHIFSRQTKRAYDATHPNVSYVAWDKKKYPPTQAGRWDQLEEAAALDLENAVASASWGRFQIMGFNYPRCGFSSARDMVAVMARSEADQLKIFEQFVRNSGIDDELARRDWAGFALVYNGKAYKDNQYDTRMATFYDKFKAESAKLEKKGAKA